MEIIAMSDIGNVRKVNQDYVRYIKKNENECLVVLCDGMGGHNAGEIASQLTCEDILDKYLNHSDFSSVEEIQVWMKEVVHHANQLVKTKSYESEDLEGMGTTVVIVLLKDDDVYISHVGDSRAYLYDYQQLVQLTKDDTLVNVLVDSGTISQDEAQYHPQKNILLQAVGVNDVLKVSFTSQKMEQGILLVCSDGLYNSLFDSQIIDVLQKDMVLEVKGEELMKKANIFGGKDNIGFALISRKGAANDESDQ